MKALPIIIRFVWVNLSHLQEGTPQAGLPANSIDYQSSSGEFIATGCSTGRFLKYSFFSVPSNLNGALS